MKTNEVNSGISTFNQHSDLIEACRKGDQKAQFQIYKLYYKAMYNTSLSIVNNPAEAEDIMQESFLTAFEEISTFSGTVSFGAWLKKIVHNRSLDMLRKRSKITFSDIETLNEAEVYCLEESAPEEDTGSRRIKIIEAVSRLSERCRNIFVLYFLEGYDHEEISEILSISASTSRSQLSRARQKVIEDLKERE
jgi:RNA polymerase sigma-70 factor (ECF subfamily)